MEMQVVIRGAGFSVRGVGVHVGKKAYLLFRDSPDEAVVALKIEDDLAIAEDSTVLGITHLATQWFSVNLAEHCWLFDLEDIVGSVAELRIEGGALKQFDDARVDVTFEVLDEHGDVSNSLHAGARATIDESLSLGNFKVASKVRRVTADEVRTFGSDGGVVPTTDSISGESCEDRRFIF